MNIVGIAAAITGIAAALAVVGRVIRWGKDIAEGIRCLLRADMLRTYYKNSERETIRQYEAEEFRKSYAAYKALGGNSFIVKVHDEVGKWKIVT